MELKATSLVYSIVALAVMVMLISTIVIPTVENAQAEQYSTDNNVNFRFKMIEETDSITLSVDSTGFSVNGTHYDASGTATMLISPTVHISYYSGGGTYNMALLDTVTATATAVGGSNTITLENNVYTINTSTPTTGSYESPLYVADANGDYANYFGTSASPFFIDNDGVLTGYLNTNITVGEETVALRGIFEGTIDELKFVSAFNNTTHEAISVNDLSLAFASNSVPVEIDSLHSKVSGRSFDIKYTVEGTDYAATAAATMGLVAPVEYKYIGDNDSSIITLLGIIPMLLIIVAVLFAVRLIGSRN